MTAVPDKGTCQLEQTQVIGWLLVVAHQYRPALGQPAQGAFHHPPPGWVDFSPDWSNFSSPIRRICGWYPASATAPWPVGLSYPLSRHRFWVSGRSTTMLSSVGLRSFVSISSGHHHAQRPACPVDQDAFLAPSLPPVRGIALAPPQNAPSPSSNRLTAIPNLRRPTPGH